jgi:hypothetical protein
MDGTSQIRHAVVPVVRAGTWLRDEEADASVAAWTARA